MRYPLPVVVSPRSIRRKAKAAPEAAITHSLRPRALAARPDEVGRPAKPLTVVALGLDVADRWLGRHHYMLYLPHPDGHPSRIICRRGLSWPAPPRPRPSTCPRTAEPSWSPPSSCLPEPAVCSNPPASYGRAYWSVNAAADSARSEPRSAPNQPGTARTATDRHRRTFHRPPRVPPQPRAWNSATPANIRNRTPAAR